MPNKIHISISLDKNYIYTCIVYLTSLLDNRHNSTFYKIHILTDNSITNEYMQKINKLIGTFGNNHVEIKFYNLEGDFKGATNKSFPLAAYYRISLPSLLTNIDKIIYTDLDGIILDDLSEMYSIEFKKNMYFCGTLDYAHMVNEIKNFSIIINKYINSGFLLINLKEIRNDGIEKKLREFVSSHELPMADQTAINAVCNSNIQILSYKYSLFALDSFNQLY
jgi:lipopolysaccharide biosynthesis glycosyltransferase